MVEGAGKNIDTIMLTKAMRAADVQFVDLLLTQLEGKLGLQRHIGIEVLIEEAGGLQNVESIAASSPRLEALIFGMGDYSASQQMNLRGWGGEGYPGDVFHYPRFRIAMAARAAGLDPVDGPFRQLPQRVEAYRREAALRLHAWVCRQVGHPPGPDRPGAGDILAHGQDEVDRAWEIWPPPTTRRWPRGWAR